MHWETIWRRESGGWAMKGGNEGGMDWDILNSRRKVNCLGNKWSGRDSEFSYSKRMNFVLEELVAESDRISEWKLDKYSERKVKEEEPKVYFCSKRYDFLLSEDEEKVEIEREEKGRESA